MHDPEPLSPLFEGQLNHSAEPVKRILAAAERCLWRAGYGGMSVRNVAEEAGVSKSVLHYYFRSKDHLLLEVQIAVYNRLAKEVTDAVTKIEPGTARALQAFDALVETVRSMRLPVLSELHARSITDPRLKAHARRLHDYMNSLVVDHIRDILGPDLDRLSLPPQIAADILIATVTGLGLQAAVDESARLGAALTGLRALLVLSLTGSGQE